MKRVAIIATGAALVLAGCGSDKISEPYKDAPRTGMNTSGAETGSMPDGFSNYSTKCDRPGIRVYVLYHADAPYGSITAIADPKCV